MQKRDIERAYALIEEEGRRGDPSRLVLAVKASADAARALKDEIREAIAAEYGEDEAARLRRGGDMVPGFLIRAMDLVEGYHTFEGDAVGLLVDNDGDVVGFYHTGDTAVVRPDSFTLRGAACVDDNAETHADVMACAHAIVYGSSSGPRNGPSYHR